MTGGGASPWGRRGLLALCLLAPACSRRRPSCSSAPAGRPGGQRQSRCGARSCRGRSLMAALRAGSSSPAVAGTCEGRRCGAGRRPAPRGPRRALRGAARAAVRDPQGPCLDPTRRGAPRRHPQRRIPRPRGQGGEHPVLRRHGPAGACRASGDLQCADRRPRLRRGVGPHDDGPSPAPVLGPQLRAVLGADCFRRLHLADGRMICLTRNSFRVEDFGRPAGQVRWPGRIIEAESAGPAAGPG